MFLIYGFKHGQKFRFWSYCNASYAQTQYIIPGSFSTAVLVNLWLGYDVEGDPPNGFWMVSKRLILCSRYYAKRIICVNFNPVPSGYFFDGYLVDAWYLSDDASNGCDGFTLCVDDGLWC